MCEASFTRNALTWSVQAGAALGRDSVLRCTLSTSVDPVRAAPADPTEPAWFDAAPPLHRQILRGELKQVDPEMYQIILNEKRRQRESIVLIASEVVSCVCPADARV